MKARKWALGLLAATMACGSSPGLADIVYRFGQAPLFDGRYGPVAVVQTRINEELAGCGKPATITVDGVFGPGTRNALRALATCPGYVPKLANDADARAGSLTTTYWDALIGGERPSVDQRARTLMLTYENTDYTRMEWNFCQSSPLYNPSAGRNVCFSNDPRSYLTWGPNGATGGGGREVQLVLAMVDRTSPMLIDQAFGIEASAIRRTFQLRDRDAQRSLETYLCGVWADASRREAWRQGFNALGRAPDVRAAYDNLYRSSSLDGGKIATFIQAYSDNGLTPTEADYGFFKDRSAHTSPSLGPIRTAISQALAADRSAPRWRIRQAIALNVRPGSQRADRLGRDVAFYIDGAGDRLSQEELSAWQQRGRLRASDAGLADTRPFTDFSAGPALETGIAQPENLTDAERRACPQAVLDTRRPEGRP
ncbi:hypothetical protein [Belnapia rosea]|uniref:Peptidoglycan binding domain-containing protein n=1 Tax=Belnapia rosea TaxID=938405 RepID=A0A1G6RLP4_9PROT|nr:hypothetical protein [Belnapia rosea]SDD04836.1 hypothetical protein SAMN04487779_100438 [Belnapia rosea]